MALKAAPNLHLKTARELRGWSQKYVAEQIGADHYYLSRWERGTAFPSPYYRSKLCALFGTDAKALGLLPVSGKRAEVAEAQAERATLALTSSPSAVPSLAVVADPAIPPLPVHGGELIGREQLLGQVCQYLCASQETSLVALHGLPGVGKTTLAVALTHDQLLRERFQDGILWAGLGPHPDILGLLSRWGGLLGLADSNQPKLQGQEVWMRRIRAAIGTRRLLLVIDDAWEITQALAFKVGGPGCAYLLTTRFPGLALQFAGSGATHLKELSEQDGLRLLARLAPQVVTDEPKLSQHLIQSVGGLPLAITLMGNSLRLQAHSGQPRRLRAAIERLHSREGRLQLTGAWAPLERPPGLPAEAPVSLQAVIELSEQQLDQQARAALWALAVFPAKPNSFSEEAALAVCQTPVEALDALSDAGLLESYGPGRYTLHQTIADYARALLTAAAVETRLAEYFAAYVEQHAHDYDALDQEIRNIFAALDAGATANQQAIFVRCVNAFFHFLFTRGLYAQEAGRYIAQAVELARQGDDDTLLATALLHQAKVAYRQGRYPEAQAGAEEARELASRAGDAQLLSDILLLLGLLARFRISLDLAETYFQESLALARQANAPKLISDALASVGSVLSDKGRHVEAEAYQQEALALARGRGDREGMLKLFINLSAMALTRGEFARGEAYGQEALALARDVGFLDAQSTVLTNLGAAAMDQEDYAKAEAYLTEALEVARRTDDLKIASADLSSLGDLARRQKQYARAADYFEESLQIARQIGEKWLLGAVLLEFGELALEQQQFDEAFAAFEEALTTAANGNQEVVATARYGLARVAAGRGNRAEAREQGQASLAFFETMNHRLTETVRAWLETLPGDGIPAS